jgi:pimeloyl-ACP methyl ester carboxylesterase
MSFTDRPGAGPPTVYVHGLAASSQTFDGVLSDARLSRYRAIRIDLLGFGASDKPPDFGYTIEDHAATVVELLDHLELTDFEVIGHSLGGAVAVLIAEALPGRVRGLVVAEANLDPGGGGLSLPVARSSEVDYVATGYARNLADSAGVERAMMMAASPVAIHRTSLSLVANTVPSIRERLQALKIPRTFLVGARSLAEPELPSGESGEGLESFGVTRIVVADAGHSMLLENPAGVAAAIATAISA